MAVAVAADVVAQAGQALLRRQLQAHRLARGHVDHHRLDHEYVLVAGQRVFPLVEHRVAHFGAHRVHVAHLALVLLVGGDLLRVRRPVQHRAVGVDPAGVVGGVAEVPGAVGGELGLLAGGHVAHPQVPVADEGLLGLVGREDARLVAALDQLCPVGAGAGALEVAQVVLAAQGDVVAAVGGHAEIEAAGDLVRRQRLAAGLAQRGEQPGLVEGGRGLAGGRVHLHHVVAAGVAVAVPEVGGVQPVHLLHVVVDQRDGLVRHEAFRPRVVLRGEHAPLGQRAAGAHPQACCQGARQARLDDRRTHCCTPLRRTGDSAARRCGGRGKRT